jgi:hypothetical protein
MSTRACAQEDQRLSCGAKLVRARAIECGVRADGGEVARQGVRGGGELLAKCRQGVRMRSGCDVGEQRGDPHEIGARRVGSPQQIEILLQARQVRLTAARAIEIPRHARQQVVGYLEEATHPEFVDRHGLCDGAVLPPPQQQHLAGGTIELADLGVDRGYQLLQPRRGRLLGDDRLQVAQRAPQVADLVGEALHALEALRLVLRIAHLGREHDELGSLRFDAERQLDQRKTDTGQAVHGRVDLVEADQREPTRADSQRCDEREGKQQLAGDAAIPGPARRRGDGIAGCCHFASSRSCNDAPIS